MVVSHFSCHVTTATIIVKSEMFFGSEALAGLPKGLEFAQNREKPKKLAAGRKTLEMPVTLATLRLRVVFGGGCVVGRVGALTTESRWYVAHHVPQERVLVSTSCHLIG